MHMLTTLNFKNHRIRIKGEDGAPWFVGRDAAMALGYAAPDNAVRAHCKSGKLMKRSEFKSTDLVDLDIPNRGLIIIPEPDLFRLVLKSKLPEAEEVVDWVVEDVMPTIRRTGSYTHPASVQDPEIILPLSPDQHGGITKAVIQKQLREFFETPLAALRDAIDQGRTALDTILGESRQAVQALAQMREDALQALAGINEQAKQAREEATRAREEAERAREDAAAVFTTADPRVERAQGFISAAALLAEWKLDTRDSRDVNRKVGAALREIVEAENLPSRRGPDKNKTWMFPVDRARQYMREVGHVLVAEHNASLDRQFGFGFQRVARRRK